MRRLTIVVLYLGSFLAPHLAGASECNSIVSQSSLLKGPAPFLFHAKGIGWGVPFVAVNFGNEVTMQTHWCFECSECNIGTPFDFEHEFICPGTYDVVIGSVDGTIAHKTVTVSDAVDPAVAPMTEVLPLNIFLYTMTDFRDAHIARGTVQWGDGKSEDFVWKELEGKFVTPTHDYLAGHYTATVTHHYESSYCSYDRTSSASFDIPLQTTPVKPSTWGAVKSIYRD